MAKEAIDEKRMLELRIFDDIKNVYDVNVDLEDLETVEDLSEVLEEISSLCKQYRHVHSDLKYLMGDDYAAAYIEYDKRLEAMRKFISSVKLKIRTVSSTKMDSERDNLVASLKIEEEIFRERLEKELEDCQFDTVVEIREKCSKLEHLLQDHYRLFSKAKIGLAGDFEGVFNKTFEDMITRVRDKIEEGRKAVTKIELDLEESAAKAKAQHEEEVHQRFLSEHKFQATVFLTEIKNRCETLTKRCTSGDLASLTFSNF